MGNWLKYAIRRAVRENGLARWRARGLRERAALDALQYARLQDEALRCTLLRAADALPAYRHLRGRLPSKDLASFVRDSLPVIDKSCLRENRALYYPHGGHVRPWWEVGRTSGTTGSPLEVFRSLDSAIWEHAFHLQHWEIAGLAPGDTQAVLRGDLVVPVEASRPRYWFFDRFGRQLILSTRHLNERNAPLFAAEIQRVGAGQLRAYPSAAAELARLNDALGLGIRFRSVVTGSETLYPLQREAIARSFSARVFDFYGMAERVAFIFECEHGGYHVHPEYSFVEILDAGGRPTEGEGFLVGTTLRNEVMPLLRYRMNDSVRWLRERCACGRNYPLVELVGGKLEERVFDLDGRPVSPSVITFAFKGVANIDRAQVAQVAEDLWELRVVPGPGFTASDAALLLRNFEDLVSKRIRVRMKEEADIPVLPSGKYKWVSQEWRR